MKPESATSANSNGLLSGSRERLAHAVITLIYDTRSGAPIPSEKSPRKLFQKLALARGYSEKHAESVARSIWRKDLKD